MYSHVICIQVFELQTFTWTTLRRQGPLTSQPASKGADKNSVDGMGFIQVVCLSIFWMTKIVVNFGSSILQEIYRNSGRLWQESRWTNFGHPHFTSPQAEAFEASASSETQRKIAALGPTKTLAAASTVRSETEVAAVEKTIASYHEKVSQGSLDSRNSFGFGCKCDHIAINHLQ